jgi:hypothetical protein
VRAGGVRRVGRPHRPQAHARAGPVGRQPQAARGVLGSGRGPHRDERRRLPLPHAPGRREAERGVGEPRVGVPLCGGRLLAPRHLRRAQEGAGRGGRGAGHGREPGPLPGHRAAGVRRGGGRAAGPRAEQAGAGRVVRAHRGREAVWARSGLGPGPRRRDARLLRRGPDLPHRPLPGEGDGPERLGPALRQRHLRADLEPALRRPRPDHRGRVDRRRAPGRLLRGRGGAARHRAEPRPASAVAHAHGAARHHRRAGHPRREGQGAAGRRHPVGRRGDERRGAGPVRRRLGRGRGGGRVPAGGGRRPSEPDRDVRGHAGAHRQLAVGGRAVLRQDGQAIAQAVHRGGHGVPRRAPPPLRPQGDPGPRAQRAGAAHPARRGHHAALRGQGAGAGVQGPQRVDGLLVRRRLLGGDARGLRAAAARRHDRRPHPVHPHRRGGAGVAHRRPDPGGVGGPELPAGPLPGRVWRTP